MRHLLQHGAIALGALVTIGTSVATISSPVFAQDLSQDQEDAELAVYKSLSRAPAIVPRTTKITLQENYGLATWVMGEVGGTAILQKQANSWSVVKSGGGAPKPIDLVQEAGMGKNSAIRLWQTHQAASSQNVPSYCKPDETAFVAAETQNYWVSICGQGTNPSFYVGVEKNKGAGQMIRVPLSDFQPQGPMFTATNGNVTYLLGWSAQGANLTASQGTRELLRERVLRGLAVPNY